MALANRDKAKKTSMTQKKRDIHAIFDRHGSNGIHLHYSNPEFTNNVFDISRAYLLKTKLYIFGIKKN